MRLLPGFILPQIRFLLRRLKQRQRHRMVSWLAYAVEILVLLGWLSYLFTGARLAWLDSLGARTDLLVLVGSLVIFGFIHRQITVQIVAAINRRLIPAQYDEKRILLELGQQARAAINTDQLYNFIVTSIGEALQTENVSIFVRDDKTGEFFCRTSTLFTNLDKSERPGAIKTTSAIMPRLSLTRDAFIIKRLRNLNTPLTLDPADFETWLRAFDTMSEQVRETRAREMDTLQRINARLLMQITIKDQLVGLLSLGPRHNQHKYAGSDIDMLMSVASQLALVIENAKLLERMLIEERVRNEIKLAAQVQQRLLPVAVPTSNYLELAGFCQPAYGIGGDYYDYFRLDKQKMGLTIADVAGKGISAALLMSTVQASLRSQLVFHQSTDISLADLVGTLNKLMCQATGRVTYVTFFYAQFDELNRQLTYVNAGHNPPFLLKAGAPAFASLAGSQVSATAHSELANLTAGLTTACLKLDKGGTVIGLFEQSKYEVDALQLESGDILIAYTDGITEALNEQEEEFGEERLLEVLTASRQLSVNQLRDTLLQCVKAWCGNAKQSDDMTFVILKVK